MISQVTISYGKVESCQMFNDQIGRKYAIVLFADEESTRKALNSLGNIVIGDSKLYVQILQSKYERKQLIENKIRESNSRLNEQYRMCNLHIRNIPFNAKEDDLRKAFSKFGQITSCKIETYILETNVGDEKKEIITSKGFGYVCYDNPESAKQAKESLDGKFLPNFESWIRPLIIDFFMPKGERQILNNQHSTMSTMGLFSSPMFYGGMRNPMMYPMPYPQYPPRGWHGRGGGHVRMNQNRVPPQQHQSHAPNKRHFDMKYFNSLESEAKREFLGEQIFKAIEESPIASKNNMDTYIIGRITGMILDASDTNKIIETLQNEETLNMLINQGLELLSKENTQK